MLPHTLQIGMYVRCSIELEFQEYPRRFAIGRIVALNANLREATVAFYMHEQQDALYEVYQVPKAQVFLYEKINRIKVLSHSEAKTTTGEEVEIISFASETEEGYYEYFVQRQVGGKPSIYKISENNLIIPFTRGDMDVLQALTHYEFHQPVWYQHRQVVADSLHTLKNATFGFETLIGSRVFLMKHQVDTIVRAISEDPCRFMLADEVGLGKTIEAAVIMKGLQKRLGDIRIVIIVPESLLYQWKNELFYKFWTDFVLYEDEFSLDTKQLIFPLEKINSTAGEQLLRQSWDLCIIDETHRLLRLDKEYALLYKFSEKVRHLLLLSATPIQDRRIEFLRLVSLLEPLKYENMTEQQFSAILEKQAFLRVKVHKLMLDLVDYLEDGLAEDFKEDLEDISGRLQDPILTNIVTNIDVDAEDCGLADVKLALAYIAEHYQIERKIIRHRRKEDGIEQQLAKRTFHVVEYEMRGTDVNFYETQTYEAVLEYFSFWNEQRNHSVDMSDVYRLFLSATFSSPWALETLIKERINVLANRPLTSRFAATLQVLPKREEEHELLESIAYYNERWMRGVELELKRIKELYDDPDLINGRLAKAMDYILAETMNEQIVIFSEWKETLVPLEQALIAQFGTDAVRSFYHGKSDVELQNAVDDFQSQKSCRFLLCDPLGGEGRNFQMADSIIHLDLPWSPTMLEQRIGRLDRIGRKSKVTSVVLVSTATLEEDLFQIWQGGLGIFEESLSGIEIAIGDIQQQITEALYSDIRSGLREIIPSMGKNLEYMRGRVEEERYFDMARQLDRHVEAQLMRLIQKFDENGGKTLARTMMEWSSLTGLNGRGSEQGQVIVFSKNSTSINSMKRTLYVLPDTKEALKRAKRTGEVRGTFMRDLAVKREGLVFYAPGDPFFDSIVNNAYETDWGRCCALEVKADVDWEGILYTWSTRVNPNPLLENQESLEHLVHTQGYSLLEHFVTSESLNPDSEIALSDIVSYLSTQVPKSWIKHLGKRSNQSIVKFIEDFPHEIWQSVVQESYENSKKKFLEHVQVSRDIERAKTDYQRRLDAMRAANLYYGNDPAEEKRIRRMESIYDALLRGIEQAEIRLESAAYVRLVKQNAEVI